MSEQTSVGSAPNALQGKAEKTATILTKLALAVGILCAIASVVAGLGARFDIWHFRVGFVILRWATYIGFGVVAFGLIGAIMGQVKHAKDARNTGLLALLVGLFVIGPPLYQVWIAKSVPPIHDISTDLLNPPTYVAVPALRNKDDNSLALNAETTKKQAEAYPDIKSLTVAMPPAQAMTRAEAVGRAMGWDIDAVDPQGMRIEATARTLLFGFRDDIVIRVSSEGAGSRVDLRSASRVGTSDIGVNAKRIREFTKQFNAAA